MDPQHPWTPGGWPPGDTYYQYLPSNGAQVPPTTSTYIHHPTPSYPTATYSAPNAYPDYGHSHQISSHNPPVYRHPISTSYHSFQPQLPSNFVPRGVPQIITADHHMPSSHTSSVGYVHAPQPCVQSSTPSHTTSQPTWDSSHVGPSNSVPMYDPNPPLPPPSLPMMNDQASQTYAPRVKRHACPQCGERFPTVTSLEKHMNERGCVGSVRVSKITTLVTPKTLAMARVKKTGGPGTTRRPRKTKSSASLGPTSATSDRNTSTSVSPMSPSQALAPSPSSPDTTTAPENRDEDLDFSKAAMTLTKRPRRNKWIPGSLINVANSTKLTSQSPFYDDQQLPFEVPVVPLPPVMGQMQQQQKQQQHIHGAELDTRHVEERNSYRTHAAHPYHPTYWNGYLPGPGT